MILIKFNYKHSHKNWKKCEKIHKVYHRIELSQEILSQIIFLQRSKLEVKNQFLLTNSLRKNIISR